MTIAYIRTYSNKQQTESQKNAIEQFAKAKKIEIDEYTPIEEVNRLCEMVEDLPEYIQEELSELQSYFGSIEELCEHEDDIICHSGCDDMADVARYYLEESGQLGELPAHLQNYIDYAAYGRDMELDGTFVITNHGVYEILR